MKLGPREWLFLFLLLATPAAAYTFVFQPRNEQIAEVRALVDAKREKLAQLKAATEQIEDLGEEIHRLNKAVDVFERKLPAQREVEVILKEVWQLATRHGLTPRSVRTDNPHTAAMFAELPLDMEITGDFDGFYSFLLDLEKLQRITRLGRMKLEKVTSGDGLIKAELVLSIFYEPREAAAAAKG